MSPLLFPFFLLPLPFYMESFLLNQIWLTITSFVDVFVCSSGSFARSLCSGSLRFVLGSTFLCSERLMQPAEPEPSCQSPLFILFFHFIFIFILFFYFLFLFIIFIFICFCDFGECKGFPFLSPFPWIAPDFLLKRSFQIVFFLNSRSTRSSTRNESKNKQIFQGNDINRLSLSIGDWQMKKNNDMILDDKTLITTWAAGNGENRELVCSLQVPTTFPHFPLSFHFPRYLQ